MARRRNRRRKARMNPGPFNSSGTPRVPSPPRPPTEGNVRLEKGSRTDHGFKRNNQTELTEPPLPIYQRSTSWPIGDLTRSMNPLTAAPKPDEQTRTSIGHKSRDTSSSSLNGEDNGHPPRQKKRKNTSSTISKRSVEFNRDPTGLSDTGSPRDPTPRQPIKVEDLDLGRSYVDDYTLIPSIEDEIPVPQTRRRHAGPEPLTDPAKLPRGWNTEEPDLDKG